MLSKREVSLWAFQILFIIIDIAIDHESTLVKVAFAANLILTIAEYARFAIFGKK